MCPLFWGSQAKENLFHLWFVYVCVPLSVFVCVCVCVCVCACVCAHRQIFLLPISHDTAVLSPPHLLLGGFQLNNNLPQILPRCFQSSLVININASFRHNCELSQAHTHTHARICTHAGDSKDRHPKEMEESDTKRESLVCFSLAFSSVDVWSCDVLWHSDVLPLWSRRGP